MMFLYLSLMAGGALGTCSRYWMTTWVAKTYPADIAYGTLGVNVLGSFIIGVIFVLIHDKMQIPENLKPFLITGFLGGFTTFSSFSLETVNHILEGQYWQALTYVLLSVVLCVLFCFLGIFITRWL
jgi:fluoride exporter